MKTTDRTRLINLNGWQRLWVVLSLSLAIVVAGITGKVWLDSDYEMQLEVQPTIASSTKHSIDELKAALVNADAAGDTAAAKVLADEVRRVQLLKEAESRERKDRELREREAFQKFVMAAVGWWLAIVLGTYALGWSVAWVRRGFRNAN
jgi:hypothetical protein